MKKLFAVIGLLLLVPVAGVCAEPDVAALIAAAPAADDYPTADQIVLYESIEITIDEEGRAVRRIHSLKKILTNWAMRRLTDPRVAWEDGRQELKIDVCRTYQPGGAVVDTPPNGFNEVTPDAVGRCAAFLGQREMVISHVGLEPGAVIELDYTVRDLEPGLVPPNGREFLQGRWPVLAKTVTLRLPLHFGLAWEVLHEPAGLQKDLAEDWTTLTVAVENLPGVPGSNGHPHRGDFLPNLVYATKVHGWPGLGEELIPPTDAAVQVDETMRAWLNDPGDDAEPDLTVLDKVRRVAALIGSQTRAVHSPLGPWAHAPRPAPEIFAASCATPWELGVLAAALLEEAGLEPQVYTVSRYDSWPKNVAAAALFHDVLVSVDYLDEEWWLAPGQDEVRPGACGRPGKLLYRLHGPELGQIKEYRRPIDEVSGDGSLAIDLRPDDEEGWLLRLDYRADGLLNGGEMDAAKLADDLVAGLVTEPEVTGTEVLQLTPDRVHLRVEAKGKNLGEIEDGVLVLEIPQLPHPVTDTLPRDCHLYDETRYSPLFLTGPVSEKVVLRLELPDDLEADFLPTAGASEGAGAFCSLHSGVKDDVVEIRRSLSLPGGMISPDDWPTLRAILQAARSGHAGQLVLKER